MITTFSTSSQWLIATLAINKSYIKINVLQKNTQQGSLLTSFVNAWNACCENKNGYS
jgi:hypothetical protein